MRAGKRKRQNVKKINLNNKSYTRTDVKLLASLNIVTNCFEKSSSTKQKLEDKDKKEIGDMYIQIKL